MSENATAITNTHNNIIIGGDAESQNNGGGLG